MRRTSIAVGLCLASATSVASADAIFTPAFCITQDAQSGGDLSKEQTNIGIAQRQLRMTVSGYTENGIDYVDFKFTNGGAPADYPVFEQSTISDIWIDDGTQTAGILAPVDGTSDPTNPQFLASTGVDFQWWASPDTPPGAGTLDTAYHATFSTDATKPQPSNGINTPTERLIIRFKLGDKEGGGVYSAEEAIAAVSTGELRIAVKMINFANGGSETFIFVPTPVSAAGGLALFGGVGAIRALRRQRPAT